MEQREIKLSPNQQALVDEIKERGLGIVKSDLKWYRWEHWASGNLVTGTVNALIRKNVLVINKGIYRLSPEYHLLTPNSK